MCLFSLQKFGDYLMDKIIVSPSILSADFANLERDIKKVENAGADWIHVDVMDGHFVNNISFGIPILKSISKNKILPNDVHLMISDPEKYVAEFINSGADIVTFHYEAVKKDNIIPLINKIHSLSSKAGISIKPHTKVEEIFEFLPYLDLVLIMSVEPGFGGQKYIDDSTNKIKQLHDYINSNNLNVLIEVDGGINDVTSKFAKDAGVDILVAGSYLFSHDDIKERVELLKR